MQKKQKSEYELFTRETTAIVYGLQENAVQTMLDFDYVSERTPSVAAIIAPGRSGVVKKFFGTKEILLPLYPTITQAAHAHPSADVLINFASFRSAFHTSMEALEQKSLRTIIIIAEGVPERLARELIAHATPKKKILIGPATVGGIKAGAFKIGNTGGLVDNIIASKLHRPGSVGVVTKSGGMANEMCNIVAQNSNGVNESIAIGGDRYPGSTMLDHLLRYEANPQIKMLVVLGEIGGSEEAHIAKAIKDQKIKKPLIAWVTGSSARLFPTKVQFGHAGAAAHTSKESAETKNELLKKAGAIVPTSFNGLGAKIKEIYLLLKKQGIVMDIEDKEVKAVPMDYSKALAQGIIRKPTNITSTISSDLGEEPTYGNVPISVLISQGRSIGEVIALLWFKKPLPKYATRFFELVLVVVADHGPAVSGAHNAIVTARAGKDVIDSLASGLLTIGPRFGGAIDAAARNFRAAVDSKQTPSDFVEAMKQKGEYIPGIGHRVKSLSNPDKRVELLKDYARKNFKSHTHIDFALAVEKITTSKKPNLILNVDGCIAALFLDLLESCGTFTKEEIDHIVEIGYANGLFALGRSIGMIGHILEQYRLEEPLYRHPTEDILYY